MKKLFGILLLLGLTSCSGQKAEQTKIEKKAELYYSHGTSKLIKKDYTQALQYLLKAKKLDPKNSKVLNNLAMAYYFKGKRDLAIAHLIQSLEINPKNSDARNNLASVYFKKGDLDSALREYELVLEDLVYEHQYRVHYNMGLILKRKNQVERAKKHFYKALGINTAYCPASYSLGRLAQADKKYNEALSFFQDASKGTCFNQPGPHFQQGIIFFKLREYQKAYNKFQYVLNKYPNSGHDKLAKRWVRYFKKNNILSKANFRDRVRKKTQASNKLDKKNQRAKLDKASEAPEF